MRVIELMRIIEVLEADDEIRLFSADGSIGDGSGGVLVIPGETLAALGRKSNSEGATAILDGSPATTDGVTYPPPKVEILKVPRRGPIRGGFLGGDPYPVTINGEHAERTGDLYADSIGWWPGKYDSPG